MSKKPPQNIPTDLKPVCKELEAIMNMGHNSYKVFEDWVGLMFFAFQRDDPNYLKIMGRYENKPNDPRGREADHFAAATAYLMEYMRKANEEALGTLFMEYASSKYQGQFFTPSNLSRSCAAMTLQDIPDDRQFTIGDPACGAGIMFVKAAKEMTFEQNCRAIFIGVDTDINCVRMCTLNMMFFNLDSLIIWGNSLSLKCQDAWFTKRSIAFGGSLHHVDDLEVAKRWMCPFEQEQKKKEEKSATKSAPKRTAGSQLTLFG